MDDDSPNGFFVEGTIEEAYERARRAWERVARTRVEEVDAPDWDAVIDFFASLHVESDRAIPILSFTYIDNGLETILRDVLNPHVHGGLTELFGPLGPLGNSSARINMAHALHWLREETVHDLHVLRRIRNHFAHELVNQGLKDQRVSDRLRLHRLLPRMIDAFLPTARELLTEVGFETRDALTIRSQLIAASALTAWSAFAELYVVPRSIRTGVDPALLMDPNSDSAPQGIIAQNASFGRLVDSVILEPLLSQQDLPDEIKGKGISLFYELDDQSRKPIFPNIAVRRNETDESGS